MEYTGNSVILKRFFWTDKYCSGFLCTVNVVIFAGGKFRKNVGKTFHMGNFHDTTPIFFINVYGFYYHVEVIFTKKTKAWKTSMFTVSKFWTDREF